jgi:predicted O-methyltransferase YrrM
VHSPFVYQLVTQVLPHQPSAAGAEIQQLWQQLCRSTEPIHILDFGAGYGADGQQERTVPLGQVAQGSGRRRREGELLGRLAAWQQPQRVLELGTNLGLGTRYLLAGWPQMLIDTVEGSPALAQLAQQHLAAYPLANVHNARFDDWLAALPADTQYDLIFIDGHHTEDATCRYVSRLLPHLRPGGLLILDDIYWSPGMTRAWQWTAAQPELTVTADLYALGLAWKRHQQKKQHFVLKR